MGRKFDWQIDLTPRVREILRNIAEGLSDEQISKKLDLNVNTVRMHIKLICSMIGAENRMQAALWAVKYCKPDELNKDQGKVVDRDAG